MNQEKLDALASQAGFDVERLRAPYLGGFPREDMLALESFAELIIRECIYIAYEYDKPKLSGPGLQIASDIESHFEIYIDEDEDYSCPTCGIENPTTSCGLPNCGLITGSQE